MAALPWPGAVAPAARYTRKIAISTSSTTMKITLALVKVQNPPQKLARSAMNASSVMGGVPGEGAWAMDASRSVAMDGADI